MKIPEARHRLFTEVFVCKRCHTKIKAPSKKMAEGKLRCRKCKGSSLRPKSKKTGKG